MSAVKVPPREMTIGDWTFYSIRLRDKDEYGKYVRETEYAPNLYSTNFDFLWASSYPDRGRVLLKEMDGMLAVFRYYPKGTLQLSSLPLGRGNPDYVSKVLERCADFCREWNEKQNRSVSTIVKHINHSQLQFLTNSKRFRDRFRAVKLRGVDRHVSVQKLLELKGSEFSNVRQMVNRFRRLYPSVTTRWALKEDLGAILELKKVWNDTSGQKYARIHDEIIYRKIVNNSRKLEHDILMAEDGGKCIGMISGGLLPHGQAWAGLHKRIGTYSGISEFLYVQFAREIYRINPRVELINLGIDLGVKGGLRAFKDKFRPVLNEERYSLRMR